MKFEPREAIEFGLLLDDGADFPRKLLDPAKVSLVKFRRLRPISRTRSGILSIQTTRRSEANYIAACAHGALFPSWRRDSDGGNSRMSIATESAGRRGITATTLVSVATTPGPPSFDINN